MKQFIFLFVLFSFVVLSCENKVKIKKNMTKDELEKIYQEMTHDLLKDGSIHTNVIDLAVSNVMKQIDWPSAIEFMEIHRRKDGYWDMGRNCGSYHSNLINYKNWHNIHIYELLIDEREYGKGQILRDFIFVEQKLPSSIIKSNGDNVVPPYFSYIVSNDKELLFMFNRHVILGNESVYDLNIGSNAVEFYNLYGEKFSLQLKTAEEQKHTLYMYRNNENVKKWIDKRDFERLIK